jgi:RND family efflux transporter MFP subunit
MRLDITGRHVDITAPLSGTVTRRQLNAGQNVAAGTELFAIADLSSVWVVVDVYEQDLASVHAGNALTITTPAFAGASWKGRVSYLDPQVGATTRTVHVRADVPNADGRLQPGMFVDVVLAAAADRSEVRVPKTAVQMLGSQEVVYVADPAQHNRFVERTIRTRATDGDWMQVINGLSAGERIVTAGAFFLRAERDRLGLPVPSATPSGR